MSNKRKQYLALIGVITVICGLILLIFSLMMPEEPKPIDTQTVSGVDSLNDPRSEIMIAIDPGHGGYDEGSQSQNGNKEKDINLEEAFKIKEILEDNHYRVIMTREDDEVKWSSNNAEDLQARLDIAANAGAVMMISIHCNSTETDTENIKGSEIYVNMSQNESLALANAINSELVKLTPNLNNREIKTSRLHLLTFNTVPTVIVEMGFLSNKADVAYLTSEKGQNEVAESIAKGIIEYQQNR